MMQKSGKVVVVSQHYPPDPSTTAAIMAAISERVAREAEVLVLSGTAGSAAEAAAGKPAVVEVRNWMPGKAALLKRALAELLFTARMFVSAAGRSCGAATSRSPCPRPSCCLTPLPPPRN